MSDVGPAKRRQSSWLPSSPRKTPRHPSKTRLRFLLPVAKPPSPLSSPTLHPSTCSPRFPSFFRASCPLSLLSLFRAFCTLSLLSFGQPPPSRVWWTREINPKTMIQMRCCQSSNRGTPHDEFKKLRPVPLIPGPLGHHLA